MIRCGNTGNTSSYYTDISRYHSFCFWEDLTAFKSLNPRRMVTIIHSSIIPYGLSLCKPIVSLYRWFFYRQRLLIHSIGAGGAITIQSLMIPYSVLNIFSASVR